MVGWAILEKDSYITILVSFPDHQMQMLVFHDLGWGLRNQLSPSLMCFVDPEIIPVFSTLSYCTVSCMIIAEESLFWTHIYSFLLSQGCVWFWFIQSDPGDNRSQTLPVNSTLSEQNGAGDSSSEIQSQRSPDGSEDGDSSQSKSRLHRVLFTMGDEDIFLWWIVCGNNP